MRTRVVSTLAWDGGLGSELASLQIAQPSHTPLATRRSFSRVQAVARERARARLFVRTFRAGFPFGETFLDPVGGGEAAKAVDEVCQRRRSFGVITASNFSS